MMTGSGSIVGREVSGARVLGLLILTYALNLIDRNILSILATPIKADLELSDTQLGLLGGIAFMFFYSIMGIPIAWLADRTSRVKIIAVSVGLWSAFTMLCGGVQSYAQLFLARVGVGVGEAGGTAPSYALIADYFPPEKRGRALAIFSLGAPIGISIGIFFGGWIATALHWRAAFAIIGGLGLLLAPFILMLIPEPPRGRFEAPAGAAPAPAPFRTAAKTIAGSRCFWLIAIGAGLSGIPSAGLLFWLPTFFQRSFGLGLADASKYYGSIMLVGGIAGIWLGGWLSDFIGKRNKAAYALVPALAYLCAGPIYLAAMFAPSLAASWPLFVVWQALAISYISPVVAAIQNLVAPNMRATASASFLLINHLIGAGFGTFVLGYMSDRLEQAYGNDALRYSMMCTQLAYVFAFILTILAAMRLKREWFVGERPG